MDRSDVVGLVGFRLIINLRSYRMQTLQAWSSTGAGRASRSWVAGSAANPGAGPPWRALALVVGAVLLLHLVLLQGSSWQFDSPSTPLFSTRMIATAQIDRPAPQPVPVPVPTAMPPAPQARAVAAASKNAARPQPALQSPSQANAQPSAQAMPAPAELPEAPPAPAQAVRPSGAAEPTAGPPAAADAPIESAAPRRLAREAGLGPGMIALPPPVQLRYRVESNKFPFRLNSDLLWRHDGSSYDARLTMGAFGQSKVLSSRGELGPYGLLPMRFGDKFRSEVAAHFERDKGYISFSANTPNVPLLSGAQDYLSIMLQFSAMLAGDPARFPLASSITVQVAGPRDAEVWLFTVERQEALALPGGEADTVKLVRHPRKPFDQLFEFWLAPTLAWLPVRLRITEHNGDYLDQKWESTQAPS